MISFKQFISEGYINMIVGKQDTDRNQYAADVYAMLQKTYASIGGIKGSGFANPEDMIQRIPFWKLYFSDNLLRVVVLYKDKAGRKIVAIATDGSKKATRELSKILKESLNISFGEYSKGLLVFLLKNISFSVIEPFILKPNEVSNLLDDNIIVPTQEYVNDNLDKSDQAIYNRFKNIRTYFYVRLIGGTAHLKIAIGTPYNPIV